MSKCIKIARVVVASLLLSLLVLALTPTAPVYAIADPDNPSSVNAVYAYENCIEDGDLGVLIEYYIDYAALPTETATESYIAIFVDTTPADTHLKSGAPFTFNDNLNKGYRRGLIWLYFTTTEVTTYALDSANIADYEIWLVGNPALPWVPGPDPPKTVANIDTWTTVGDPSSVIALRVLYYASQFSTDWTLDLLEETAVGDALTALGSTYFTGAISDLRTIAPDVFSSREIDPTYIPVSYDTAFGATASSGGATVIGSPVTLVSGVNVIDTGITIGTVILDLAQWTYGTITDNGGTVTGSPVDLTPGVNTVTVTAGGTFDVDVAVVDAVTIKDATILGTGMDLTTLGAAFGMSRWVISGLIWMLITLILCAAVYRATPDRGGITSSSSKAVLFVFTISVVGGWLLGMLSPLVVALLIIACGAFIGYIFFFRSETLHKGFMFMAWMFVIVSMAGSFAASGVSAIVATRLTADVTVAETSTITVASTEGFPDSGFIMIGDEIISYPEITATTFRRSSVLGVTTNPLVRGDDDTEAAVHSSGDTVRTRESGFLNSSIDYRIARIADSAGAMDFIALPFRLMSLIVQFFTLPLGFLGTDLATLSYIWMVVAAGMVVGFAMQVLGGRRV